MFEFFKAQKISPNLLANFASCIDAKINKAGLRVLNTPDVKPIDFELEMRIQDELVNLPFIQTYTNTGSVYLKKEGEQHKLVSSDELDSYFDKLAKVALARKTINCVSFSAVALFFAKNLLLDERFQNIKIDVCSLKNWGHVFIKFSIPGSSEALFYDPWYQRCDPEVDSKITFTFDDENADEVFSTIVSVMTDSNCIAHVNYFQEYNLNYQRLLSTPILNGSHDYNYEVIHEYREKEPPTNRCSIS